MKIDMVTVDDWFVLLVNGERVDEGHSITGQQAFETLVDLLNDKKKFPAGIFELTFKEHYLEGAVGNQELIDRKVDRIIRDWDVQKTLQWFPDEWKLALFNIANGKEVKYGEYPYGVLTKCKVLQSESVGEGANVVNFYTVTQHGHDVVKYLEKTKLSKEKKANV